MFEQNCFTRSGNYGRQRIYTLLLAPAARRQLAQSGGDRNWHPLAAMSRQKKNPRSENAAPPGQGLEPPNESGSSPNQRELHAAGRPRQVRLQKEVFQAAKTLVRKRALWTHFGPARWASSSPGSAGPARPVRSYGTRAQRTRFGLCSLVEHAHNGLGALPDGYYGGVPSSRDSRGYLLGHYAAVSGRLPVQRSASRSR